MAYRVFKARNFKNIEIVLSYQLINEDFHLVGEKDNAMLSAIRR